ncbi:MAG: hypothetical protein H7Y59_16175 [Anaerolineales bacterium]|nr:hypothetical protein [Anaerolineales bacterium]
MKKYSVYLAVVVLVLASLACQTIMGGGDNNDFTPPTADSGDVSTPVAATPESNDGGDITVGGESQFPVTSDAFNVASTSESVSYQTNLSSDDVLKFYRDEFGKMGLTEDESLSVIFGSTFTMTFTGHESGKNVYLVGADAGDGSLYITIALG